MGGWVGGGGKDCQLTHARGTAKCSFNLQSPVRKIVTLSSAAEPLQPLARGPGGHYTSPLSCSHISPRAPVPQVFSFLSHFFFLFYSSTLRGLHAVFTYPGSAEQYCF